MAVSNELKNAYTKIHQRLKQALRTQLIRVRKGGIEHLMDEDNDEFELVTMDFIFTHASVENSIKFFDFDLLPPTKNQLIRLSTGRKKWFTFTGLILSMYQEPYSYSKKWGINDITLVPLNKTQSMLSITFVKAPKFLD